MAKGKKGENRRRGDSWDEESTPCMEPLAKINAKELDFSERRELRRKAVADKRRSKLKCHLCGTVGHVVRECPGILSGSVEAASKGVTSSKTKGAKNRGRKGWKSDGGEGALQLPPGFSRASEGSDLFLFYDAGCDIECTIEYLRMGRGKILSTEKALAEYRSAEDTARCTSNYGGCVCQSYLRPGKAWSAPPFVSNDVRFALGFGADDNEADEDLLYRALIGDERVAGAFCDFSDDRSRKLQNTCRAASRAGMPVRILLPKHEISEEMEQDLIDTLSDLPDIPIHLSRWSGTAQRMNRLLHAFPRLCVGIDATVTFTKAIQAHECAFDLPLSRIVLETGAPDIVPAEVARKKGREAFAFSGWLPFAADAVGRIKGGVTAEEVARAASNNTLLLYPSLANM